VKTKRRTKSSTLLITLFFASLSALAAAETKPVLNINTADAKQFTLLPRVGLALAERIVGYRKDNGPFKTTDELMLVRGVGEKLYAQLKPYLATSGETTLAEKVASPGRAGKAKGGKGSSRSSKAKARSGDKAAGKAAKAAPARSASRAARSPRPGAAALSLPPRLVAGGPR
jgi:competence protein ComEA